MFNLRYEDRLSQWRQFRDRLETSKNPYEDLIEFYKDAPIVSIHTDPYDPTVWPNPWELINENQYDEFCILLGMAYSLQLCDRFTGVDFEIHIGIDTKKSITYYLLKAGDTVMSIYKNYNNKFPVGFQSQLIHKLGTPN